MGVESPDVDAEEDEGARTALDRLLVGRDRTVARRHLRVVVALAVGQALFTTATWALQNYGVPERNLVAFGAMLALAGVVGALYNGYRNGGVLVSVALAVAPLIGAVPAVVLQQGASDDLVGTALIVGGLGVWVGAGGFLIGAGLHRLRHSLSSGSGS